MRSPKAAFVFINPTYRNISSNPGYEGPRFPFIGVSYFWKVLSDSGWISRRLVEDIAIQGWGENVISNLVYELNRKSIYITNLVKCTLHHGDYPEKKYFDYHLPLFERELELLNPKRIITFGTLTTQYITDKRLVFKEYFRNPSKLYSVYGEIRTYPCYFPVGRGNPKLARKILRSIKKDISS